MPVRILFFGILKEKAGGATREVEPPESVTTLAELVDWLAAKDEALSDTLASSFIRIAVDQRIVSERNENISDAREIAFMPPFSGG